MSEALNGTCTFQLPEPVSVFHAYKGFALPDEADFSQTIYTFTFPYIEENLGEFHFRWLNIKGLSAALPISIMLFFRHLK